ncbi:MAG: hypothetical protein H7144_11150 [Burkholderiales bacterium]|nr:hypothetical protein [Phycisphaerae bacterium]
MTHLLVVSESPIVWLHALSGVAWAMVLLGTLLAAAIRLYFNLDRGVIYPLRYPVIACMALLGVFVLSAPPAEIDPAVELGRPVSLGTDVMPIIQSRCVSCHAAKPTVPLPGPPKGVMLETPAEVKLHVAGIYNQVVLLRKMPSGNLTKMTDYERAIIASWFRAGAKAP